MHENQNDYPHYSPVGDSALLIELSDELTNEVNDRVHALDAQLKQFSLNGVIEWLPAYTSLLVIYDPMLVDLLKVQEWVRECLQKDFINVKYIQKCVEIPVHYGGEYGPDLGYVAQIHDLTTKEVIEKHVGQVYRVAMMGFTPGFAYLIGLVPELATPRLESPRTLVPKGSVGIAGNQTGIYPVESPGGWQIIGRTDLILFNPEDEPHFLLAPGDKVRFTIYEGMD